MKNKLLFIFIFGINDNGISQNTRQYFMSLETRSIGISQIPLQFKLGVPSISHPNFIIWHFISVESNRTLSPAFGVGTGCVGKGFQIPRTMFLLGEFQFRYVTPQYKAVYPSLTHLNKVGLGYRFKQPISLTLMTSFDNQWSFFSELGLMYLLSYTPKPTQRRQIRCPRY